MLRVALALTLVLTPAVAHHAPEGALNHLIVLEGGVAAGGSREVNVSFQGAPLRQGWLFLVNGFVDGPLSLTLSPLHGGDDIHWDWSPEGIQLSTTRLPAEDHYVLTLRNHGDAPVHYRLYFDQTCDCVGKVVTLPGGYAWFNWDLAQEEAARFQIDVVEAAPWGVEGAVPPQELRVSATVVEPIGAGRWPNGFVVLDRVEAVNGPVTVDLPAGDQGTRYVLMQAVFDQPEGAPGWEVQLRPVEQEPAQAVPLAGWTMLVALLAACRIPRR